MICIELAKAVAAATTRNPEANWTDIQINAACEPYVGCLGSRCNRWAVQECDSKGNNERPCEPGRKPLYTTGRGWCADNMRREPIDDPREGRCPMTKNIHPKNPGWHYVTHQNRNGDHFDVGRMWVCMNEIGWWHAPHKEQCSKPRQTMDTSDLIRFDNTSDGTWQAEPVR